MTEIKVDYTLFTQNCRYFAEYAHEEITSNINVEMLEDLVEYIMTAIKELYGYIKRKCD